MNQGGTKWSRSGEPRSGGSIKERSGKRTALNYGATALTCRVRERLLQTCAKVNLVKPDLIDETALNIYLDGASLPGPRRGGLGIRYIWVDVHGNEQHRKRSGTPTLTYPRSSCR